MRSRSLRVDTILLILVATLVTGGAFIFASAAFGLLARGSSGMSSVMFNHLVLGVGAGLVLLVIMMLIDYRSWRRYAPYIFALGLIATALVFVPHIGAEHGGGRRWIIIANISFQPSEALKIAAIIMASAYFAGIRLKTATLQWGFGGFAALMTPCALLLVLQPDLGTLGVIVASVGAIYWTAGARIRDIAISMLLVILALGVLAFFRPYVMDRVQTFFHPSQGQQAEGYQIRQSLIAIGSGGFFGRGFGQGVQKFTYLPEPMGDSIFAVAGEELGFVGSLLIVALFLALALRGYAIAAHAADPFGTYLATGISTYLGAEAFINIAAMLGIAPLTGIPLTFVSQGGSAMLISLASAGILLSVSKGKKRS